MTATPRVHVLLASFNGERYIEEQVTSILAQQRVDVTLTIRDDGSTDATLDVLARFASDRRVELVRGAHLGVPAAFFELLDRSRRNDYVALADQDDVWLPDKLRRAVDSLADSNGPALYSSTVRVVDESLAALREHPPVPHGLSFGNALVQNVALGCTIVLNDPAVRAVAGRWPEHSVMHDAWLYAAIAGLGAVVHDPEPSVLYRQHGGNVVGLGANPLARQWRRIRRQLSAGGAGAHGRQNVELLRLHGERLAPQHQRELCDFIESRKSLRSRWRYVSSGAAHRQTRGSDVVFRLLYLLDRI